MADNNYWKERFLKDKARSINLSEKYIKGRLKTYYTEAAKEIENDIAIFYEKYAKDEKITLAEARKRISEAKLDRSRFEKMAKETAALKKKYGNDIPEWIAKQIAEQERILNTLSKKGAITRLENLKAGIDNAILKLYDKQQITMYDMLKEGYQDGYYRGMFRIQHGIGIGTDFTGLNERAVRKAVLTDHGKGNFSSRLYNHSKTLSKEIQENLTVGIIRGESIDKMARRISKRLDVSMSNAKRLVRTETAYIHELAALDSYKEAGITTYRFVATLDNRTSEICQELDRKEFPVEKATPGENFPPMHPNCRSTTEAVFYDEIESTRTARNSDGSQYMVPRDMTYPEWKEKYVDSKVENAGMSGIIKNIKMPTEITGVNGITEEIIQAITSGIESITNDYRVIFDGVVVRSLGEGNGKVPFQYVASNDGGFLSAELVVNSDYCFNGSLEAFEKRIKRQYEDNFLTSKTVGDLLVHEMAHILTFQDCDRYSVFERIEEEVREKFIPGVSGYADITEDGAETIAEAFVKYRRGEELPEDVMKLIEEYLERWRK